LLVIALALIYLLAAGCHTPEYIDLSPHAVGASSLTSARAANYVTNILQEGDLVSVSFQNSTNFNALQKISLDGVLNLEGIGQVRAAGKTPIQLQNELLTLYKPQVKEDSITVRVVSPAASVYVSGAVNRPGKIALERPLTALEAIMEAGGFDPNRARLSEVTVLRLDAGKQRAYHLNLKRALKGADETPFYLKPFDIVHVPTRTFNF
jgi:polysaccharide export outer membrane protein